MSAGALGVTPPEVPARVGWRRGDPLEALVSREWLVTNGLGGYAAGTLGGVPTRRFHGLLVAALAAPLGRTMMLNHVIEQLRLADGTLIPLSGLEPHPGPLQLPEHLIEMRLVNGRPVWLFEHDGLLLEKSIVVPNRQNSAHIIYRLRAGRGPVTLVLEPALDIRGHEGSVAGSAVGRTAGAAHYELHEAQHGLTIESADRRYPALHLLLRGERGERGEKEGAGAASAAKPDRGEVIQAAVLCRPRTLELLYRIEQARGYDFQGTLHAPCVLELPLEVGDQATLTASTERWDVSRAPSTAEIRELDDQRRARLVQQADPRLQRGTGAELVLAADQFIITPHTRPADEARLHAEGDDARTVIAGYHWFTDWGRDTMISLEGLTLCTGRHAEARDILHTFAFHIRDGLIPNLFPEGKNEGLYHTADATLWFFHALDRYERATGEKETRWSLMPQLVEIVQKHLAGTRFGIGVDPADGLLRQGAEGYQLTWMDAKVGDWVVTPRRGKAVEINALFYNALCLLEGWLRESDRGLALSADQVAGHAAKVRETFNRRFWNEPGGYLYDVLDGDPSNNLTHDASPDDASLRPNQLLAISLPNPVLERERWPSVMRAVRDKLATPFGLRSLAPGHPDYKARYDGDLRARDAAYHQGTVWGWLIGPFVDAWLKTFPGDREGARRLIAGLEPALDAACVGSISEIFDAESPFNPRGCVAQAWSVAEALRALLLTTDG